MKRILLFLAFIGIATLSSCEGERGPQGPQGPGGFESEVFELQNVNFQLDQNNDYTIFQNLSPIILDSDNILIYRMSGTINAQTPVWQLIPRTLFLDEGELDYDYDFSRVDFTIYAGGTYNLALTPQFIQNQTFRIVILPGYFSKSSTLDVNDYNAVINYYKIDESDIKVLN